MRPENGKTGKPGKSSKIDTMGKVPDRLPGMPPFTGDARLAWESAWPLFARSLTYLAKKLTDDLDAREDLLQVAKIALFVADPTRYDLRDPLDVRYLRQILKHRMWKYWRRERKQLRAREETPDEMELVRRSDLLSWREKWEARRREEERNW
jgi:DNA-directed RNA polymerase specialized sigma24 family protein